ncbi:MAG TPA: methyltransferase [Nitrososphaera sp.]
MIYTPSDDTFLLAECAGRYRGRRALELGIGSGLILSVLEKNFEFVAGSDIDLGALAFCQNRTSADLICCDAASAIAPIRYFDLIVSNPPYLPDDREIDSTVHGGPTGVEKTIHFVESAMPLLAKGGKMLIVVSSLADPAALDRFLARTKIQKKVLAEKKLFYETIVVAELRDMRIS